LANIRFTLYFFRNVQSSSIDDKEKTKSNKTDCAMKDACSARKEFMYKIHSKPPSVCVSKVITCFEILFLGFFSYPAIGVTF
jgi:hypothetical protein